MQAQIIHVPADCPTIQQGINTANPGDTVLVSEGTYYEQINFLGKKPLMVASHFLMDGDTSHISNTIIDGSQLSNLDSASVVYFVSGEDTTSILCGFTITNGKGTQVSDQGNTTRGGGGIYIDGSGAKIIHNHITENHINGSLHGSVQFVAGAGIVCAWRNEIYWVVIDHNKIDHNSCFSEGIQTYGAGLIVNYSCRITNNTISNNTCTGKEDCAVFGSGVIIATDPSWKLVTSIVQNNVIKNNRAESQNSSSNGGGGYFQCVTGIFSDNEINGNVAKGSGSYDVGGVGFYEPKEGFVIRNNTFRENSGTCNGAILMESYEVNTPPMVLVGNNYFIENTGKYGGALATYDVPVHLQNNVFSGNQATVFGGAVRLERGTKSTDHHLATIINNSFSGNSASYGGAICSRDSKPLIINSVFWGNHATHGPEIYLYTGDSAEIAFSTINPNLIHGYFDNGDGNLNTNPMFEDTVFLTLSSSSSCINNGTLEFTCGCGVKHNCPAYDILGTARPYALKADMGAYESNIIGIEDFGSQNGNSGISIFPNPVKVSTTIKYSLPEPALVNVFIFDNCGRLIAKPVNACWQSGEQEMLWNAEMLPAGIYYCWLQAGEYMVSNKVIKTK